MTIWNKAKQHIPLLAMCTVLMGLGTFLTFVWFQWQLNPDAASYFTIAEKYANGDIRHAINGYWGPLLSWLLVPAVWLDLNLIIAAKIITLIAATGILILIYRFLLDRGVSKLIANFTCLGLTGLLIGWSIFLVTPDMLITFFAVLFAIKWIDFLNKPSRKLGVMLGVLGAFMYFSKGFGFYLFLGVVSLTALWQWRKVDHDLMQVVRRYLPMVVVFAILVAPFIGAISLKYNKPTVNNAGQYDHHIYGPVGQQVSPMTQLGPLQPPNDTAMSIWEDPTLMTNFVPGWNPVGSWDEFGFFWNSVVGRNLNTAAYGFVVYGPVITLAVMGLAAGVLQKKKFVLEMRVFTGISLLMIAGYSLVLIDVRYLWATMIMASMGAALYLSTLQSKKVIAPLQIIVCGVVAIGLTTLGMGQAVVKSRDLDKGWYNIAMGIKNDVPKGSNIVTDDFSPAFFACYHLDLHCYSMMRPPVSKKDQKTYYETLKRLNVQYYVSYQEGNESIKTAYPQLDSFVKAHYTKVTSKVSAGQPITVYKLR